MMDPGLASTKSILSKRSTAKTIKEDEDIMLIVIPPDGGWGWVVVFASFFLNLVADGTMYTFGLFLKDIAASFNTDEATVAVGNSLMTGFYYLVGPLVSALLNRFGFRIVAMSGAVLASLAYLSSSFLYSLPLFLCIYGVLGGIAFCMVYIPSVVIVGFYFEKWRAIATAISMCGSSTGIMVFPAAMKLMDKLHWRRKFQILSGVCLLTSLLGILYRPLKPQRVTLSDERKVAFTLLEEDAPNSRKKRKNIRQVIDKYHNRSYPTTAELHQSSTVILEEVRTLSSTSVLVEPTSYASFSQKSVHSKPSKASTWNSEPGGHSGLPFEEHEVRIHCCRKCCCKCCTTCCHKRCCRPCRRCCSCAWCYRRHIETVGTRPLYRDDIFFGASSATLSHHSKSMLSTPVESTAKSAVEYQMSVTRSMTARDLREDYFCICCPISIKRTLATMLDFSLLKSPSFLIMTMSGFFTVMGLYTPFAYLVNRMVFHGINKSLATYLMVAMGVSNAAGRIFSGSIVSCPRMDATLVSWISLLVCGTSTMMSGLWYSVEYQYAYACTFSFTIACVGAIRSIMVVELSGVEKLTNAFGIMMTVQGIACFIGLPVAGALIELTGDFDASFYFAGLCVIFSALLLVPLKAVARWENSR